MSRLQFNGKILQIGGLSLSHLPPQPIPVTVKYGYLYNFYAIDDSREISNNGWHVPSRTELQALIDYFGGDVVDAGNAIIDPSTSYWQNPSGSITNSAKFNLRGSGYRTSNGSFINIKLETFINTSTISATEKSYRLNYPADQFMEYASFLSKDYNEGSPIRLLKDSTSLSHGQEGTYVGNDLRQYRTICIGTQEWLADNLSETKYRNGDEITTVTGSTEWSNLTSGAKCAYNNTESNVLIS